MSKQLAQSYYGKKNDHVATPPSLYDALNGVFSFTNDPCPLRSTVDSLKEDSLWGEVNWINPPFSNIAKFIEKAIDMRDKHEMKSVMLCPVRTNTNYWSKLVWPNVVKIWFIKERVKFVGYDKGIPAPMCLLLFGYEDEDPFDMPDGEYTFNEVENPVARGIHNMSIH
jgi:hypothetical protein